MPWENVNAIEKQEEFVLLASKEETNVSALCRCFGIGRKTGYKGLGRHQSGQIDPLLTIGQRHPACGDRKISDVLAHDRRQHVAPNTVTSFWNSMT